jgi:flagellar hook-associated protein 2
MAISSATGLISGLDINKLLTASMVYERLPLERAQRQLTSTESKISAMGQVKSAIDTLREAAKNLSNSSNLYSYKGSLSNPDVASVTAGSNASAGTYQLEVTQLASSQKIASVGNIDTSAGGTLAISIGGNSTNVSIAAGASLSDIAKSINGSGAAVSATVVNGENGSQLVLTGNETGTTNQISISGGAGGLAALNFDPANANGNPSMKQLAAAQNAIVKIDGITLANTTSNTINDALTGVSLTLKSTTSAPTQLTVSSDSTDFETKLKAFVDAYNGARTTMQTLSKYDTSGSGNSGALNGDGTVSSAINELRGLLSRVPAGVSDAYRSLTEFGVETSSTGVLSINTSKLKSASQADFASVAQTVAAYGSSFETAASKMIDTNGLIGNRLNGLNSITKSLNDTISTQERRIAVVQARYETQFANLENMLASMTTTENFLTQQLASLSSLMNRS